MSTNKKDKESIDNRRWKTYNPKKEKGIIILTCRVCGQHHYHVLNIGGKGYAQCGRCGEMVKI